MKMIGCFYGTKQIDGCEWQGAFLRVFIEHIVKLKLKKGSP